MRLSFSVLLAFAFGLISATWTLAQEHPAPATDAQPPAAVQNAQQATPPTQQPSHAAQSPAPAKQAQPQQTQPQQAEQQAQPQHAQQQTQPQQRTADQEHAAGRKHSADANFRYYNNRWWYWQNDAWLMWDGSRWLNRQERAQRVYSSAPRRSFSYTEDTQGFVPTEAGIPRSSGSGLRRSTVAPGTVEYQRVIPSYGRRSAGAKVLGNY